MSASAAFDRMVVAAYKGNDVKSTIVVADDDAGDYEKDDCGGALHEDYSG